MPYERFLLCPRQYPGILDAVFGQAWLSGDRTQRIVNLRWIKIERAFNASTQAWQYDTCIAFETLFSY